MKKNVKKVTITAEVKNEITLTTTNGTQKFLLVYDIYAMNPYIVGVENDKTFFTHGSFARWTDATDMFYELIQEQLDCDKVLYQKYGEV